jgi:hypothetical protein
MIETMDVGVLGRRARRRVRGGVGIGVLVITGGCTPSMVIGPLSHEQEERDHLLVRAKTAGISTDLLEKVVPPLTPDERLLEAEQNHSCRSSYVWKNGLTYTGSGMVAAAAGITIGGAYATGNTDTTKAIFGVTGGTMALAGALLVAIGAIIQNNYTDRGCVTRLSTK